MREYFKYLFVLYVVFLFVTPLSYAITLKDITPPKNKDTYGDTACFFSYRVLLEDPDNSPIDVTRYGSLSFSAKEADSQVQNKIVYTLRMDFVTAGTGIFQIEAKNAISTQIFSLDYECELRPTVLDIEFFNDKFMYYGYHVLPYPSIYFRVLNFKKLSNPTLKGTVAPGNTLTSPYVTLIGSNVYLFTYSFNTTSDWTDIMNDIDITISYSDDTSKFVTTFPSFLNNYPTITKVNNIYYKNDFRWGTSHTFYNLETTNNLVFIRNSKGYSAIPSLVLGNETMGLYYETGNVYPIQETRYLDETNKISTISTNIDVIEPIKGTLFLNESIISFDSTKSMISLSYRSNCSFTITTCRFDRGNFQPFIPTTYPFGYSQGNGKDHLNEYELFIPQTSSVRFYFSQTQLKEEFQFPISVEAFRYSPDIVDVTPPFINWFNYFYIDDTFIMQMNITDDISGFGHFSYYSEIKGNYLNLVEGTLLDGIYEFVIDPNMGLPNLNYFTACDRVGNCLPTYYIGSFIENPRDLPIDKIKNITFEYYDIDVSNQSVKNKLYVYTNKTEQDLRPVLTIMIPGGSLLDMLIVDGKYDDSKGCFVYPFEIHKGYVTSPLLYSFQGYIFIDYKSIFGSNAELLIKSNWGDAFSPQVIDIQHPNGGNIFIPSDSTNTTIKWRLYIQDHLNGLKNGEVIIKNSLNLVEYKFILKPNKNNYLVSGDKYNGVYELSIPVHGKCKDQQFRIVDAKLVDEYRYASYYNYSFQLGYQNALMSLFDNIEYYTTINVTCEYGDVDNTPPKLVSFDFNPKVVDVTYSGILNQTSPRIVTFDFVTYDESGIMLNALPRIYISDDMSNIFNNESRLISSDETHAVYQCQFEIPFGFGFNGVIKVSLYGIVDNQSNFKGYTSSQLPVSTIQTLSTLNTNISILSASELSSLGGILHVKGIRFALNDKVLIQDHQFNTITTMTPFNSSLTYLLLQNIQPINTTIPHIYITIQRELTPSNYQYSNSYKILISDYQEPESSSSSAETYSSDSNVPSNPVQTCINDCSGNGDCTSKGCVCKPTWIGLDCSSQIIIVPPKINDTIPETNFTIPSSNNDKVIYYAVISVVGLNEIGNDGSVINRYTFNQWIANNNTNSKYKEFTNSTGYLYTTSLLNANDQSTTNLNVSIDYFNIQEPVNITFANQLFIMNPYSLKYSINITQYQFKSSLNSLQLILSATIESNDNGDECSSKQTGTTVESESQFIKMQINDHSLYGRFIKRGIIDNRIKLVTNTFLDSEYNVMDTTSKSQSYIGINIPFYNRLAQLDPDFSILIDHKPASESDNSICTPSKSKLSKAQIAGIVIGAFGFVAIVTISTVYYFYKKRQMKQFEHRLSSKIRSMDK